MRRLTLVFPLIAACTGLPGGNRASSAPGEPEPVDTSWLADVDLEPGARLPRVREQAVAASIQALGSEDFSRSSAAASELARRGLPVAPYLGHAGMVMPGQAGHIRIALKALCRRAGATGVRSLFDSPYRDVRLSAAHSAGERHLTECAPGLVDLLEDDDPQVRRAAVVALRQITNRFFGFRPEGSEAERRQAVARWRALWGGAG